MLRRQGNGLVAACRFGTDVPPGLRSDERLESSPHDLLIAGYQDEELVRISH